MDNILRSLRAHFLAPVHTTVPVDFLHTDIVSNFFSGICQVGRSLAHSLLHRILLSLLVQVQPSTSLTWTPSGKRFGITFLLLLAFPADSFYNSLALSNSAPFFRLWGCLAHFLLHHNLLFFLERTFLVILNCGPCHLTPIPAVVVFTDAHIKVNPPPGYNFPSRYTSHRTERHRLIIRFIEVTHPLKVDHRYEFLRDQDRIAFSSHTSSIPPIAKASRGRQWRAARPRPLHCVQSLLFPLFSKVRDKWSRTLLCVTGPISLLWLLLLLFYYLLLCFGGFGVHLHNSTGSRAIGTDEQPIPQPTVSPVLFIFSF